MDKIQSLMEFLGPVGEMVPTNNNSVDGVMGTWESTAALWD